MASRTGCLWRLGRAFEYAAARIAGLRSHTSGWLTDRSNYASLRSWYRPVPSSGRRREGWSPLWGSWRQAAMVKRRQISTAAVALITAALAACGSSSTAGGGSPTAPPKVTLNVWLMSGSAPTSLVTAWNNQFEQAHPNVTVNVSLQQWSGIVTKTETNLATSTPPDVLEMGNTYVASFAATGGLADLTNVKFDNQTTWLQSLQEAGTYNSKLYGVPYYAGDRIAIYNTAMFQKAGISAPPTTTTELLTDCAAIKASEPGGTSCLYVPGEYWYA